MIRKGMNVFFYIGLAFFVFAVLSFATVAFAAITVSDTETSGNGNSTTLTGVIVSSTNDIIIMQAADSPGTCTRDGLDFIEYDSKTTGFDAYPAHLMYLESPTVGTSDIVCSNSIGLTAAVFSSDQGAITFTGIGKDSTDTSPGIFALSSANTRIKVGVLGFSQNSWDCDTGCTDINSGGNRGGVFYTSAATDVTITITQSSNGINMVYGELTEGEGGIGGGGDATSTPGIISQDDYFFLVGLLVFFAAVPFWDRVLTVSRGSYEV